MQRSQHGSYKSSQLPSTSCLESSHMCISAQQSPIRAIYHYHRQCGQRLPGVCCYLTYLRELSGPAIKTVCTANVFHRAGALYNHVASKIIFVRIFRRSRHVHSHTWLAWTVWISLLVLAGGIAYVLAVGIAVFFLLAGLAAAAFASWFTYGLAGEWCLDEQYTRRKLTFSIGAFWWHGRPFNVLSCAPVACNAMSM